MTNEYGRAGISPEELLDRMIRQDALRIAGERIHKSLQESAVRTAGNLLEQGVPLWVVRKSVLHLPEHFLLELQKQKMN